MSLELVINGMSLDCNSLAEAELAITALILRKVTINKDGKRMKPVVNFEEAE